MTHNIAQLSRDWFDQVWNRRDDAAIARFASPRVICHGLGEDGKPVIGLKQFKQMRKAFLSAFPDLKIKVNDLLVDGDKTAIRITFTGKHTGQGLGIPPTGRSITATGIILCHSRAGRIVKVWNEFDAAGMMRQLQSPAAKIRQ